MNTNHNFFKNSFFPSTINKWNNLDSYLRKSESFLVFKSNIRFLKAKFIGPSLDPIYNYHNPTGICLITRRRLGLSHLRNHKFKHGLQNTLNPLCSCGNDVESTENFLLHCLQFVNERRTLLSTLVLYYSLLENTCNILTQTLLFGNMEIRHLVQAITPRFLMLQLLILSYQHCVKRVQIRNFFWSVFFCIRTEYRKIRTRKTLYLNTFHAVQPQDLMNSLSFVCVNAN